MQGGCCCFMPVSTGTIGVLERLGKFERTLGPGLRCYNPCTDSVAGVVTTRVQQLPVSVPTKSKDNVVVTLDVVVQYRALVERVEDAFYKFTNPQGQITSYVASVVRGQAPLHTLDELFTLRDEIQKVVKSELDALMANYGFVLAAALICDISPARTVREAMNQINTNARLKLAQHHRSEAEKYEVVKNAEAEAEAKRLAGVGIAEQRKAIVAGMQSSLKDFRADMPAMQTQELMWLMAVCQYCDCVKEVSEARNGTQTVFLPGGAGMRGTTGEMLMAQAANLGHGK